MLFFQIIVQPLVASKETRALIYQCHEHGSHEMWGLVLIFMSRSTNTDALTSYSWKITTVVVLLNIMRCAEIIDSQRICPRFCVLHFSDKVRTNAISFDPRLAWIALSDAPFWITWSWKHRSYFMARKCLPSDETYVHHLEQASGVYGWPTIIKQSIAIGKGLMPHHLCTA